MQAIGEDEPLARIYNSDGVPATAPFVVAGVENGFEPSNFNLEMTDDNALVVSFTQNSVEGPVALSANVTRPDIPSPVCDSSKALCLQGGRFRVSARWLTPQGSSGVGEPVQLSNDTGYFWFFSETNIEVVTKVLDACGFVSRYWVFAGGLTDVEVVLRVDDLANGTSKSYSNSQSTAFQPIQDGNAFATCDIPFANPAVTPGPQESIGYEVQGAELAEWARAEVTAIAEGRADLPRRELGDGRTPADGLVGVVEREGTCVPSDTVACLNNGRFAVEVDYVAFENPGLGEQVTLTGDTAYFWFFAESNVEVVVKVLDACGFVDRFWVFAGGLTDVEATLTITDTVSGEVRVWENPASTPFQPIQDTAAFATCSA